MGVTSQAISRGATAGKVVRVLPTVYAVAGLPETLERSLRAACLWSRGIASHRSAAWLWGLEGCDADRVEITVARAIRSPHSDVIVHQGKVEHGQIGRVRGIPATDPTRTLLDLGQCLPGSKLELALEDALRRRLTSLPRLKWQLQQIGGRGRPGTKGLRDLVISRGNAAPTESGLETKLAAWFRTTALPPPVRQHRLIDEQGRVIARFDFAYPEQRVAIEGHSFRWHSGRQSWVRDVRKERAAWALGWKVIYAVAEDITSRSPGLEERIARELGLSLF